MRRHEKEITDTQLLKEIIESNTICHIALVDGDSPYLIPMNYGYRNNTIYLHSAAEGNKIDILEKNNRICLEISDSIEIRTSEKACCFGTGFRSVICKGRAERIENPEDKASGLQAIMKQHTGRDDWEIPAAAVEKTAVFKIQPDEITGKISG